MLQKNLTFSTNQNLIKNLLIFETRWYIITNYGSSVSYGVIRDIKLEAKSERRNVL